MKNIFSQIKQVAALTKIGSKVSIYVINKISHQVRDQIWNRDWELISGLIFSQFVSQVKIQRWNYLNK